MNEFDNGSLFAGRGNREARVRPALVGWTGRWLSLVGVLFVFACGKSQNGTGNTNWHLECETSESCEGDSICQCNYCTPRCDGTLDCSLPPEEICVAPSSDDDAGDDAPSSDDDADDDAPSSDDDADDDAPSSDDDADDAAATDDSANDDSADDTTSDDSRDDDANTDAGETPIGDGGPSPSLSCEDLAERAEAPAVSLTVRNARSGSIVLDSSADCPEFFTIDSLNESSPGSWQMLWCGGDCTSANGPQPVCGGCETPQPIVLAPGETTSFSWPALVGEVVDFPGECCDTPPCPNTCTRRVEAALGAYQVNLRVADATDEQASACGADPVACPVSMVNGGNPTLLAIPFEHTGAAVTVEISGGESAASCPLDLPNDGAACTPEGMTCAYEGTASVIRAVCREGQWIRIREESDVACPAELPLEGSSCEAQLACTYDCEARSCALPDAPTPCTATQASCSEQASGEFTWTLEDVGTCPFTPSPECSEREPATECELDSECWTLNGRPIGSDGTCYDVAAPAVALGCAPSDLGCAAVIQAGVDPEGTCWLITSCMPADFRSPEPGECPSPSEECE